MLQLLGDTGKGEGEEVIGPYSSIREMTSALKKREVSSVELTEMYLKRLKTLGHEHNAVAELTEDLALKQATPPRIFQLAGVRRVMQTRCFPTMQLRSTT